MMLGKIAFLGSGETSRAGGEVLERFARDYAIPVHIAILETPAGFELNSQRVAGRVADFMRSRLQEFQPEIEVIPARKRGTPWSPDEPAILGPLLHADLIFMGPGSPTYAIRQLHGSLAWELIRARHRLGACLVLASSAAIAVGAWGLPVYEIFKVGAEVEVVPGLDLLGDLGMHVSFITHWNNTEGGDDLDTSRCFIGRERFQVWHNGLPSGSLTVGLDEHTWLAIDFEAGECEVGGVSTMSLLEDGNLKVFPSGTRCALTTLGAITVPDPPELGIARNAWDLVCNAPLPMEDKPPRRVLELAEERRSARSKADWSQSDRLRDEIAGLGWHVVDTPTGQKLVRDLLRPAPPQR
jgi:hypothetical protein